MPSAPNAAGCGQQLNHREPKLLDYVNGFERLDTGERIRHYDCVTVRDLPLFNSALFKTTKATLIKRERGADAAQSFITSGIKHPHLSPFLLKILLMSSSDDNPSYSSDRSSDESSDYRRDRIDWDPDKAVFTFPRMHPHDKSEKKKRQRSLPPLSRIPLSSQDSDSVEEQKFPPSRKRKWNTSTRTPLSTKYPKLPPSPTYHSNKSQPASPEPIKEDSFHDLVKENNELRARIQAFERIDHQFLEAASSIGEVAFSSPAEEYDTEPLQQILHNINTPAAEGCLVLLERLGEVQNDLAGSQVRESEQSLRIEELDEASREVVTLLEKIKSLEESKTGLERDYAELNLKALSKSMRLQETDQQIKALVLGNKRFKEVQISDGKTISELRAEVKDLKDKNHHLERQETRLKKSTQASLTVLERFYDKFQGEKSEGEPESGRIHENNPIERSATYNAENKKAAAALARVMDMFNAKEFVSIFNSLSAENPFDFPTLSSFSDSIEVFVQRPLTPEHSTNAPDSPFEDVPIPGTSEDWYTIREDDPCKHVRLLLKRSQEEWIDYIRRTGYQHDRMMWDFEDMVGDLEDTIERMEAEAQEQHNTNAKLVKTNSELSKRILSISKIIISSGKLINTLKESVAKYGKAALPQKMALGLKIRAALDGIFEREKALREGRMDLDLDEDLDVVEKKLQEKAKQLVMAIGDQPALPGVPADNLPKGEPGEIDSCDEVRAELAQIKKEKHDLEKRLAESNANAPNGEEALGKENKKLQDKINGLEAQLKELRSCDDVRKELEQIKKEAMKKKNKGPQDKINELETQLRRLRSCDDVRKELEQTKKELRQIRKELERTKKERSDMENILSMRALDDRAYQAELKRALEKQRIRYVKRINILHRRKQEEMFSVKGSSGATGNITLADFLRQDGPPIKEYSDVWFATQWNELYDKVLILCNINYCGRSDHQEYDYRASAARDELLSYYLRDTVLSENTMHERINDPTKLFGQTFRANVAVAIVFRILVEEIFDPIRFLLNLQFQDPTQRWRTKLQLRFAFEEYGTPQQETKRQFQDRTSWCTRKATEKRIPEYRPRGRRTEDLNYMKEMENKNYGDDNDIDALVLNTTRAKMMLAMFQSLDDEILHERFQELRSDVSMLIRDTLSPLRLPRKGAPPPDEKEAWNGQSLKLGVEEILKFAFNLAVTMRSQRRIIYVNLEELELLTMISFKMNSMTDVEQPEDNSYNERNKHDGRIQTQANEFEEAKMAPFGKVHVIVQPALWRKGTEYGDFSATNVQVLSKAKVIVGTNFPDPNAPA